MKYRLLYILIRFLSLLPMRILYILSDIMFFSVFYVIHYRKKVVYQNLKNAFPEKKQDEIDRIAKRFFKHLCDFIVEVLKLNSLSIENLEKRISYPDNSLLTDLYNKGKGVVMVLGHYGNWEYGTGFAHYTKHIGAVIYMPLQNKFMDELIKKQRAQYGYHPIAMSGIYKWAFQNYKDGKPQMIFFLGDQRPSENAEYWTTFLNQETGVYLGAEKLARKLDLAVVYGEINKVKRGKYEANLTLITDKPKETSEYEITEAHVKLLEDTIKRNPEYWLWSHKRWKHKRNPNLG